MLSLATRAGHQADSLTLPGGPWRAGRWVASPLLLASRGGLPGAAGGGLAWLLVETLLDCLEQNQETPADLDQKRSVVHHLLALIVEGAGGSVTVRSLLPSNGWTREVPTRAPVAPHFPGGQLRPAARWPRLLAGASRLEVYHPPLGTRRRGACQK
jgi:hypothetical protein